MAFVEYSNLHTPDDVLNAIETYLTSVGYTIVQSVTLDYDIYTQSVNDGSKLVVMDNTGEYYIIFRSANGTNIFGTNNNADMDATPSQSGTQYYGIGMTISEGYSAVQRWYNQYNAPTTFLPPGTVGATDVQAVWMPVPSDVGEGAITYSLFCNLVTLPTHTVIFSLVKTNGLYKQTTHLSFANMFKYDEWDGGIIFSGSATRYMIDIAKNVYLDSQLESDSNILPLYSSSDKSNTFLRIDIDEATLPERGSIFWASGGTDMVTGKPLSLPIRVGDGNGAIPSYSGLQSINRLDSGLNVNTLNCITVNLPLYVAVRVDPDLLDNYACVGSISGIFFISLLNVQTTGVYEISYPESKDVCQVFPFGRRRGHFGFDGLSIKQEEV